VFYFNVKGDEMEEKTIGIVIIVVSLLLLGFSLFVNISEPFGELSDPLVGEGLGKLCNSFGECRDFCENNLGRCLEYCDLNPENEVCGKLFIFEDGK
jgi:hypothetical protein